MRILISGAGVAGPTLAYWLDRAGHEPVIVERAKALRTGGYVIDFWGAGYTVAERMGVIEQVRAKGYQVREVRFVRDDGSKASGFSTNVFERLSGSRFTSLPRGDLAACLHEAIAHRVETRFGDHIVALDDRADGIGATLASGATIDADLVIGADGLHSGVRALVFGAHERRERDLGYRVAAFTAPGYQPRDPDVYVTRSWPGRSISRFALRNGSTLFLLVMTAERLPGALPDTDPRRIAALRAAYARLGWETDAILAALEQADDLYLDRVSQIEMPRWSKGRVGLVGDAAACVSLLAGEGTGLGMTEAFILAAALAETSDHVAAFARYEAQLHALLAAKQKAARGFAKSFLPESRFGIVKRDLAMRLMAIPKLGEWMMGSMMRDEITLPPFPGG